MNYEKDVFISYAHLDDQPLTRQQQGWVSQFHESLTTALGYCGHKAVIWRDQKLSGNDLFNKEIVEQLAKAAILVSVLSPAYVASEYCRKEIEEFYRAAEQNGMITVGNKSRIIKVIKRPFDNEEYLPPFMKGKEIEGYQFYKLENDNPLELDPSLGVELAQGYARQILKLAKDISELIDRLHGIIPRSEPDAPLKPSVYLGHCSRDRGMDRESLLADLKSNGYRVYPENPLPTDDEERFVAEVSQLLTHCSLSVHLVGCGYGAIPDGPRQKSVVELENELAVRRCKAGRFNRIIWLRDGTVPTCQQQQRFIEALGSDREAQYGADLITVGLEDLKGAIYATLQKLEKAESQPATQPRRASGFKLIYVISDKNDEDACFGVRHWLTSKGFEVEKPIFQGKAATVRKVNQETLALCDAAILFYGVGDEAWKRTVENDLRKANGYRREKPPFHVFNYISGPATDDKRDMIRVEEPNIINGLEGFQEAAFEPLLNALQKV